MDGLDLLLIAMLLGFGFVVAVAGMIFEHVLEKRCLLYTSDAADESPHLRRSCSANPV